MFTIAFRTTTAVPNRVVSLRCDADGWAEHVPGWFEQGVWTFRLDERDVAGPLRFKFLVDAYTWMAGPDLVLEPVAGARYEFTDAEVAFFGAPGPVVTEHGRVERQFLNPNLDEQHEYDVIVVGSGAGGGVLADQLSDLGSDVLLLEVGSYLFPTHVGNLARQLRLGQFEKSVWGLWDEFGAVNYVNEPGSFFGGAQGFNLGGRSIFWGGLIPRLGAWEMADWPAEIRDDLLSTGYRLAEDAMNRVAPAQSGYQDRTKALLGQALPGFDHLDAPLAVQYQGATPSVIPAGLFSTADLLLEGQLTDRPTGVRPTINLHHAVTEVLHDGDRATGVRCTDLLNRQQRTYRARHVVLAAGPIESAKIALRSGLTDPQGLIGRGITDHPIFFTHFALPAGSPHADPTGSAKVWSRHRDVKPDAHPYNVVVELGSDFNQGRYVDPDDLRRHRELKGDATLGEIVFLLNVPLQEQNFVALADNPDAPVRINMQPAPITPDLYAEMQTVAAQALDTLGARPLASDNLNLKLAGLGGVAHEVGTLRIGGVVDANLRFLGYENLYACDNSVLPSSPAANPTLTLVALALRLARHLTS